MEWKIFHKDENNSDYHYSTAMADPLFEVNSGKESLKKRIGPVDLKEQNKTSAAPAKETSASRTGNLKGQVDLTAYLTAQDIIPQHQNAEPDGFIVISTKAYTPKLKPYNCTNCENTFSQHSHARQHAKACSAKKN